MKTICIFIALLFSFSLFSQSNGSKNDVLKKLQTAKEDSNKVNMLLELGRIYSLNDKKIAENYFVQAGNLSKKINYTNGIHDFYGQYLDFYTQRGKFEQALPVAKEAVSWFQKTKDSLGLAKAYANLGSTYLQIGDYENTIKNFEKGRILFEQTGNPVLEGQIYDRLQNISTSMHQYKKGVEYGLKAVNKLEKQNKPELICYAYINLGLNYLKLNQFSLARQYFEKAMTNAKIANEKPVELLYFLNVGYIHLLQGNYDKAIPFAEKGLTIAKQFGSEEGMAHAYWGFGEIYMNKKDYNTAKKYADSASVLIQKNNFKEQKVRLLLLNSKLAYAMQDPEKGSQYSKEYEELRDNMLNESQLLMTTNFEKKYETFKKDSQIKEQNAKLQQRKLWNFIFAGAALSLLIIGFIVYRNFKHRQTIQQQKISELETEKQLAATEAVLRGEEQERSRLAKDLHDGLGGMLSGVKHSFNAMKENLIMTPENAKAFEKSIDQLDNSIREMRRVAHNMLPENLMKYGLNNALREFCNEMNRASSVEANYLSFDLENRQFSQEISVAVYRIVQELANNTLKHAEAKHFLVQTQISEEEKTLYVTVEDDGKGFNKENLYQTNGIGWKNIENRIQLVKGKIDVNSEEGKGTSVLIEIPI